jgi:hypothetical protein
LYYNRVTLGNNEESFPYLVRPKVVEIFGRMQDAQKKAREIRGFMLDLRILGEVETRKWSN